MLTLHGGVIAAAVASTVVMAAILLWRQRWWLIRAEFTRLRRAAGLRRATVTAAGHRWVYASREGEAGDALTVVMLHGFTGSKENWYPLARVLDTRYRLLIPDLPGWGESERKPGAVYGFAEQAAHVAALIAALSPQQPVVLLGHSMGGGIAALVAARYPQQIARVGLFNAAGVRFADNHFGLAVLAGENPFAVSDAASLRRYIDTVFHCADAKPWIPWPASSALIQQRRNDADFEQSVLEKIGRTDDAMLPGAEASQIHQPALLLWGRQDAVIDPSAMAIYAAQIPQAEQVLLDNCGHMSIAEHPHEVALAVTRLITTNSTT